MKPSTIFFAAVSAMALGACSGNGTRYSSSNAVRSSPTVMLATGPIYTACIQSDRRQASRARCGCVQAVANQSLLPTDQRRGASFFGDPHTAQEVRTSDRAIDERFWLRWKAYGDSAAQICT
jgi:hypothetical protein